MIDELDHSFLCDKSDVTVRAFLEETKMKHVIVDFFTTAENIASMLLEHVINNLPQVNRIQNVRIRVYETEKTFAEVEREL